ncbi:phage portal protein [Rhodomicrobium lacus]|uniref:phage portal protein n=1 Tax=Rhodomicrobium lacus TaxID=2498452 RepID=UPI000F8E6D2A|nr:phage portal protein [Rhodomicrobium lacus]
MADPFTLSAGGRNPSFEAAGRGRRLSGFNPPRNHVNRAIQAAGDTILSRARWLYENDGICGNAVDEWAATAVAEGVKLRPRVKGHKAKVSALLDLFWRWAEEADADGVSDFYGMQERIAREVFLAGECFVRIRHARPGEMATVPFQLQILPAEMLDLSYEGPPENPDHYIRMGIEFDARGRRVAYHFWRWNPNDYQPPHISALYERVRVPADQVIHVYESRQGGQIRGVPRVARVLVKTFGLEVYDDAELDRKKTAALFTAFLTGRGEPPFHSGNDDDDEEIAPTFEPGAIVDLGEDRDVKFSTPAEVGGSYEPFQYRNILKICAGLGMPYAIVSGDVTRGNFSNVRTAIIQFRRRVRQWQYNVLAYQLNRVVWRTFVDLAVISEAITLPGFDKPDSGWLYCDSLMPRMEMIDPLKDVQAEKEELRAGLKSRTMALAERGYDREDVDDEIAVEREEAKTRGIKFDIEHAKGETPTEPDEEAIAERIRDEGGYREAA